MSRAMTSSLPLARAALQARSSAAQQATIAGLAPTGLASVSSKVVGSWGAMLMVVSPLAAESWSGSPINLPLAIRRKVAFSLREMPLGSRDFVWSNWRTAMAAIPIVQKGRDIIGKAAAQDDNPSSGASHQLLWSCHRLSGDYASVGTL